MTIRIIDVREITQPISSPIRNAYIDFTKMTTSLVAVVVQAGARRVVGYGFNSNGRYGQGGLIRERFAPRLLGAAPETLVNAAGDNLDADACWAAMMANEKPGGHGERSVAVGTLDMAIWDAVASGLCSGCWRSGMGGGLICACSSMRRGGIIIRARTMTRCGPRCAPISRAGTMWLR